MFLRGGWRVLPGSALALLVVFGLLRLWFPLPYADTIARYADETDMDPYLIAALIRAESSFLPDRSSPKGARGLMQIMPDTGTWIAQQMQLESFHPDELFDPETNIRLGTWYLAHLMESFQDDPVLALAAYNGGPGKVREWQARGDFPTGIRGAGQIERIPFPETRAFVGSVLQNYRIYRWLYPNRFS